MLLLQFDGGGNGNLDRGYYFVRNMEDGVYWESQRYRTKAELLDRWVNDKLQIKHRHITQQDENRRDYLRAKSKMAIWDNKELY